MILDFPEIYAEPKVGTLKKDEKIPKNLRKIR